LTPEALRADLSAFIYNEVGEGLWYDLGDKWPDFSIFDIYRHFVPN